MLFPKELSHQTQVCLYAALLWDVCYLGRSGKQYQGDSGATRLPETEQRFERTLLKNTQPGPFVFSSARSLGTGLGPDSKIQAVVTNPRVSFGGAALGGKWTAENRMRFIKTGWTQIFGNPSGLD